MNVRQNGEFKMNYKTYAEAKIANPDCEIVTTGKNCAFVKTAEVIFEALLSSGNGRHKISDDCWAICNPADYCSTLKEFLDAGFNFAIGDLFLGTDGTVHDIEAIYPQTNKLQDSDDKRYILSAAVLNGGCKIQNVKPWTIYNNTLQLSELSDEQAAMLFNAWRAGGGVEFANTITKDLKSGLTTFKWSIPAILNWGDYQTYRIKQKSERELFIENTTKVMRDAGTKCPDNHEYFGIMFDAGARYTDLTQHFGENI